MTEIDRTVLPIPDEALQNRPTDKPGATVNLAPISAPEGAPNVIVVLIDDMGFAATSTFGGPCATPTADRLADRGLKYSRFHTTALCSPTRQALLTGRNHHAVNMGTITNLATPVLGYTSVRPRSAAPLAEVLRMNGYKTGAFGKMHQTPPWETSPAGPFDRWPTGEGFESFYGIVAGETNQYAPLLFNGTTPVDYPDGDYHFSDDIVTRSIEWMQIQQMMAPDAPFFLYLSFGATHAPHHVPQRWIDKYKGRFDHGWDAERERILKAQRDLGLVPDDCELTRRHDEIPPWDDLTADEKKVAARLMEAYAGFAEHTDAQVGRLIDAVEEIGVLDNTLVFYILGDNGASAEGGESGAFNEIASLNGVHDTTENILAKLDEIGGPNAYNHYPAGWAHAMNTPYQWTKQVASHWGGTRVGMVTHWPEGIAAVPGIRHQWHHVIDIMPTILDAAGIPLPRIVNGTEQQVTDGVSMRYSFDDGDAHRKHTTQYFEMFGNRGIYHEGWMACTKHITPWDMRPPPRALDDDVWELYGPDDWSQSVDVAHTYPDKLAELQELFKQEALRNNVLPLDDRRVERFNPDLVGRPDVLRGRKTMTLKAGMKRLVEAAVPNVKNKSHTITAEVTLHDDNTQGVVIAQGGRFGGWVLHFTDGVPQYSHNWLGLDRYRVSGAEKVGPGQHTVTYEFAVDEGAGFGRGGQGRLFVDGELVGSGRIDKTIPFHSGSSGSTDVGIEAGTPVIDDYQTRRGEFTGDIGAVTMSIDETGPQIPADVNFDIEMSTQ